MELVPKHERDAKAKHLRLSAATVGSNSMAAPGTGLAFIPIYAWCSASAVSSVRYLNGTGGSALFEMKVAAGGYVEIRFWEEPSLLLANQCPVIESETNGIGVHDFHVWVVPVRAAGGSSGLSQ